VTGAADFASGKGHRDENFPVASRLVRAELRPTILAFYRFARAADDVADHESASPERKLAELERLEAGLRGETGASAEGERLRVALQTRALTDRHALDLLEAFRRDVTKRRYSDWAELMDYCRYSASPVGRFVLDLHGESTALWPLNDALCNALQVINHLQDCAKDYRQLDRVYVPVDALSAAGLGVESLADPQALRPWPTVTTFDAPTLAERARARNPQLQAELARLAGAQKIRDLTLRNRYPDLVVGVVPTQVGSRITQWGLMFEINIPLQQDSRRAQEREAEATVGAARARSEALSNQLLAELAGTLSAFDAAVRAESLIRSQLLPQSELSLQSSLAAYENGKVDFATLLEAQRQIRKGRQELLKSRVEAQLRLADIERILGEQL